MKKQVQFSHLANGNCVANITVFGEVQEFQGKPLQKVETVHETIGYGETLEKAENDALKKVKALAKKFPDVSVQLAKAPEGNYSVLVRKFSNVVLASGSHETLMGAQATSSKSVEDAVKRAVKIMENL